MEDYLFSSDYQFGFKGGHGTELCIFALKDVVHYYRSLGSHVFICFLDIKSAFDRVSYNKLFHKLLLRGVPKYLVHLLLNWYKSQRLRVKWGGRVSDAFNMGNGIKQGSALSPILFNIYIHELNEKLSLSKIGCHIDGTCFNHLAYADDLALLAPSAKALNKLLSLCEEFAEEHYVIFSPTKTVCMVVHPAGRRLDVAPNVYLKDVSLKFVSSFKYLGHILTSDGYDDQDIQRETRSMYARGNLLHRRFYFLSKEIKCCLFRAFCYGMYTNALWSTYRQSALQKIKVCYNNMLRKLVGITPWTSVRPFCAVNNVSSFGERRRSSAYSLMVRVQESHNSLIQSIRRSDARTRSLQWIAWHRVLYTTEERVLFIYF